MPYGPLRLIDSPIRFMQARAASGPPRLRSALLPVVLNASFVGAIGVVAQSRVAVLAPGLPEPVAPPGLSLPVAITAAVVFGLIGFWVRAAALVMFDMLTGQSIARRRWRLVELSAMAYWPQLLWSVPTLAAVWWFFDPPPMVYRGAGGDVMMAAMQYGEQLAGEPFQVVMTRTQQMAGVWLIALHACVLRVVSGFKVSGAWAAGIVLTILFLGFPVAIGAAVQRFFF